MTLTGSVEARRRQHRLVLLMGLLTLVSMATGVIVAGLTHPRPVHWARLGPILGLVAVVSVVPLLVMYRRGRRSTSMFAPSPLLAFPAADRRRLLRVIKRGAVMTGPDRDPAIAAAEHLFRNRALLLIAVAAGCQLVAALLIGPAHPLRFWLSFAGFACMTIAVLGHLRLRRRASRFLTANRDPFASL